MRIIRSRINNNNQFWFSTYGAFKHLLATIEEYFYETNNFVVWSTASSAAGKRNRGARKSEVA